MLMSSSGSHLPPIFPLFRLFPHIFHCLSVRACGGKAAALFHSFSLCLESFFFPSFFFFGLHNEMRQLSVRCYMVVYVGGGVCKVKEKPEKRENGWQVAAG